MRYSHEKYTWSGKICTKIVEKAMKVRITPIECLLGTTPIVICEDESVDLDDVGDYI